MTTCLHRNFPRETVRVVHDILSAQMPSSREVKFLSELLANEQIFWPITVHQGTAIWDALHELYEVAYRAYDSLPQGPARGRLNPQPGMFEEYLELFEPFHQDIHLMAGKLNGTGGAAAHKRNMSETRNMPLSHPKVRGHFRNLKERNNQYPEKWFVIPDNMDIGLPKNAVPTAPPIASPFSTQASNITPTSEHLESAPETPDSKRVTFGSPMSIEPKPQEPESYTPKGPPPTQPLISAFGATNTAKPEKLVDPFLFAPKGPRALRSSPSKPSPLGQKPMTASSTSTASGSAADSPPAKTESESSAKTEPAKAPHTAVTLTITATVRSPTDTFSIPLTTARVQDEVEILERMRDMAEFLLNQGTEVPLEKLFEHVAQGKK